MATGARGEVIIKLKTKHLLFPLGTRLITENLTVYRYMLDGDYYRWMEEEEWMEMDKSKHPERFFNETTLKWLNSIKSIIKETK